MSGEQLVKEHTGGVLTSRLLARLHRNERSRPFCKRMSKQFRVDEFMIP